MSYFPVETFYTYQENGNQHCIFRTACSIADMESMQLYAERCSYKRNEHTDGAAETRKFFLNCLCLLLGRLVGKRFESIMSEYGLQISEVLLSQVTYAYCVGENIMHSFFLLTNAVFG